MRRISEQQSRDDQQDRDRDQDTSGDQWEDGGHAALNHDQSIVLARISRSGIWRNQFLAATTVTTLCSSGIVAPASTATLLSVR